MSTGDPIRDGRERKREKNAEALDAVIGDRREESVPSEDEAEPLGYGPDAPAADAPWTYWWAHFQREKEREQAAQRISYPGSIDAGAHGPEGGVAESPSLGGIVRGKFHALREREAGLVGFEALPRVHATASAPDDEPSGCGARRRCCLRLNVLAHVRRRNRQGALGGFDETAESPLGRVIQEQ